MNATMLGLAIAIPCMIAFSFLINKTNRLMADVDQSAVRVMDILKQRYYAAEELPVSSEEHAAASSHDGKVVEMPRRTA